MDARASPQCVGLRHLLDQDSNLGADGWPSEILSPRKPAADHIFLGEAETTLPAAHHYGILNGVTAFTRIALKLGLLDRERVEFWRFLAHTAVEHPRKLAEAMKLAAMGYHFRKLTEAFSK